MTHTTDLAALVDAVWQVLDDMGATGKCCCGAAKAALRVAYEPFRDTDLEMDMPLSVAQQILGDVANGQ